VESYTYRYSFDKELLQTSKWNHNYLLQPELQAYFQEVARKHDLYRLAQFSTELRAATWNDNEKTWSVRTNTGDEFIVKYLVTALGILHKPYIPEIAGLDTFQGKVVHSSRWETDFQHEGKRIAVIGSGASGVQLVGALGETAGTLTHFIRHAQYVIPAQYRAVTKEERKLINESYDQIWDEVFTSTLAMGFVEPNRPTFSVSPEDRERIFESLWAQGNGFRFMIGGFSDIGSDEAANKEAIQFIHKKIKEIVKDEQKAEVLISSDWFARRPLTDDKYYSRFNQENVSAVNLKKTPIESITPTGIKTSDGKTHEVDLIVFATGFDSSDGSYLNVEFKGRQGKDLKEHWKDGPRAHIGASTSEFPNLFFVNGPGGVFANKAPVAEEGARLAVELITHAEKLRKEGSASGVVESTKEADEKWLEAQKHVAGLTLFSKTSSWLFGENIPGRVVSPRFFLGGLGRYRNAISEDRSQGWAGFTFS
jgi:cyclohexanone monooxygenase